MSLNHQGESERRGQVRCGQHQLDRTGGDDATRAHQQHIRERRRYLLHVMGHQDQRRRLDVRGQCSEARHEVLPTAEVEAIKSQISASEEHEKPKVSFEVGETVKINNGPFLNFSGVIEEVEPERGKLKVTVNIFGRNTPVELEYWQVEKG